jgi:hypothetical protein
MSNRQDDQRRPIGPTPERLAKAGEQVEVYTPEQSQNWRAIRLSDESPLEYLQSRGVITGDQYAAGMRYYGDWYMAGLAYSGTIDPSREHVDGGRVEPWSDRQMDAMTRYNRAMKAIGILASVLSDVLTNHRPMRLEDYGRLKCGHKNVKLARFAAREQFKLALQALDHHYYGQRRTRPHVAHAEDYRPEIHKPDADP